MNRYAAGLMVAAMTVMLAVHAVAQKNNEAAAALQAARQKERVEGDLPGAIKQYAAIAAKYATTDRATAAIALVRGGGGVSEAGRCPGAKHL